MIKKVYNINNEIVFENPGNDKIGLTPVIERDFTQDELNFPKWNTGKTDIVVDIAKRDANLIEKRNEKITELKNELKNKIDQEIENVLSVYPDNIRLSFPVKEKEAENFLAGTVNDPQTETPTIYTEASIFHNTANPTNTQLTDIANRIITNANAFKQLAGKAQAISNKYLAEINDAQTDIFIYTLPDILLN